MVSRAEVVEYYCETDTGEVRAADPASLALNSGLPLQVDEAALYRFLLFGEEPKTGDTFFVGVKKTPIATVTHTWKRVGVEDFDTETPQAFEVQMRELIRDAGQPFSLAQSTVEPLNFLAAEFADQHRNLLHSRDIVGVSNTAIKLAEWLQSVKKGVYFVLMSPEFYERPYFNQRNTAVGFSDFLRERDANKADIFWRLLTAEIWLREFFDVPAVEVEATESASETVVKLDTEPNIGKKLDIQVGQQTFRRFPLRTKSIERGDNLEHYAAERVNEFLSGLPEQKRAEILANRWHLFISEKIVAITQTRSFFVWEIEPGWWARKLSARITPSSYGYGLSIPWTMQLAINEVGLARILLASAGSVLGKLFGKAGWFYIIAGAGVRAIDGPLESPVYPSFLSAKLAPSDGDKTAALVSTALRERLEADARENFAGTVIIDANDVGRHVLGKDVSEVNDILEAIFADNPLGQGGERTPLCFVMSVS